MPKLKLKPRLTVGTPFMPEQKAPLNMRTQGTATVVDDKTGKALLKVGDSPNGPETLTVTPPEGMHAPSAAGGATLVGGGVDLQQQALQRRRALLNASMNTADQQNVAKSGVLQSTSNRRYGELGVAAPQQRRLQFGQQASNSPFLQDTASTQGQLLQDQYNQQDLTQAEQDYANSKSRVSLAGSGGGGPSGGGGGDFGGFGSSRPQPRAPLAAPTAPRGNVQQIMDPRTGETKYVKGGPLELQAAQAEMQGLVAYDDPFNPTGKPQYLTPAEAKIRGARDDRRMSEELDRRYPKQKRELEALNPDDLVDVLVSPEKYAKQFEGMDGQALQTAVTAELHKSGFSDRAIKIMMASHKKAGGNWRNAFNDTTDNITPSQTRDLSGSTAQFGPPAQ